MINSGDWFSILERDARRFSILFIQLGHAFSPLRNILNEVQATSLTVQDYLATDLPENPKICIIKDLDTVKDNKKLTIGQLRERVMADVDLGYGFILVSSVPRNAYEFTAGSDLVVDAKHVFAPLLECEENSSLNSLPSFSSDIDESNFLLSCVQELSPQTVMKLSEAMWELSLSPNECISFLSFSEIEALRGAGLLTVSDMETSWIVGRAWKNFRNAVAIAASRYIVAGSWLALAFQDLWLIERIIRNAIRNALIEKQGEGWRETCLPNGLRSEVLERARRDAQPSADKMKDLRDPLEWLTTSELLELRENRDLGALGLESYLWQKLRGDVLPIRNRAAHMRMISEQDALMLSNWRKLIERKVH